ncbi:helix-turn-helix transcriptional regulator [Rahnella sp. BCC 1045]|jgi:transcriptional regulator with XRE-family HTH domain|uniref:helix-turn-helix domain-containing protein n=1 Tax=Rahnella sp. BCC 1045 TaxID=2816251 RepID=UPI001C25EBE0|nr:XRE family transcriptional regulator [Rahnella sp. BCC 1045]MBU9820801.1 helix-turn-helix transcriptional regulator [Rahnella sp. BCC 1045]
MQELTRHIGSQLKAVRSERGWSLTQAAEKTGVSKAMLGQIERGESSPTVATLWKIASGLNVSFSEFLETPPEQSAALHRHGLLTTFNSDTSGMRVVPLFPYDTTLRMDMFVIDLEPGGCSESTPHEAGVIEHVIVIDGELTLTVDGVTRVLSAGEALRFAADCAHAYRNKSEHSVRFHDLIHYPQSRP